VLALTIGVSASAIAQQGLRAEPAAPAATAAPAAPAAPNAWVEQPRAFGHQLGDVLEQRVRLDWAGVSFHPATLPAPGRVNVWFERRGCELVVDAAGDRWLHVRYQLIAAPQDAVTVTLPPWSLAAASGAPALQIPAWSISVMPISPRLAYDTPGMGDLRPDRPVPTPDPRPLVRAQRVCALALGAALMSWLGWWLWRNRSEASRLPFARSRREMKTLPAGDRRHWILLHRAIDETAGLVIHAGNVQVLFDRAPALLPSRPAIERFLALSNALFFADGQAGDTGEVRRLCAELFRLERRTVS
jgi:mxaA protein